MTTQLAGTFIFSARDVVFFASVAVLLAVAVVAARVAIGGKLRTFELPVAPPAQIVDEPAEQAVAG